MCGLSEGCKGLGERWYRYVYAHGTGWRRVKRGDREELEKVGWFGGGW